MEERESFGRFAEFWPFYLSEHRKATTRRLHFVGSTIGLFCLAGAAFMRNGWWVVAGLGAGYVFAWFAHFFVEKNRPATFKYPLRSFAADFKMWGYMITGKLDHELERFGIS